MLDIVLTIAFGAMAIRIARAVKRESAIFREFNQPLSLALVVFLFPFGPIVYPLTVFRLGWLVAVVASVACYLPGLIVAKRGLFAFDRAGTDRVGAAQSVTTEAFGTAIAGLVYVAVLLVFTLIPVFLGGGQSA